MAVCQRFKSVLRYHLFNGLALQPSRFPAARQTKSARGRKQHRWLRRRSLNQSRLHRLTPGSILRPWAIANVSGTAVRNRGPPICDFFSKKPKAI
jgi:hypothetical protein